MRILVVERDPAKQRRLEQASAAHEVIFVPRPEDIAEGDAAEGLIGWSGDDVVLGRLPNLRWAHTGVAGVDDVLTDGLRRREVTLTSSAGNGAVPLAEQALLLMLMLSRSVPRWLTAQAEHRWERFTHGELHGHTLGIIGLGHCGTHLAGLGRAAGMRVLALARRPRPVLPDGVDETFVPEQLPDFLPACDFIVVTAAKTPATVGLLDRRAFSSMRSTAYYVCVSRGGIADDDALLEALRTGQIAGAGLDAHAVEPLPPDSPFWALPNVIITPHNGATTNGTAERGFEITLENLRRFCADQPLLNVVDKQAGY